MDLGGIYIPTVTPFDESGEVDLAGFQANIRSWLAHPVDGLVVGGSTGEAVLLDEDERRRLWLAAREVSGGRTLIAGTGAESTRATLRLGRIAADAGADAVLVQPPAFYRAAMTHRALADHYQAVADASSVPVILYQVPPKLGTLEFTAELVAELADHDNIVGIKDSRGSLEDLEAWVDAASGAGFQILVGSGALLLPALRAGAVGGILGVANLVPDACVETLEAFRGGRDDGARELQERVVPLHTSIVGGMGVPGVKAALDLLGLRGGDPRLPLRPLARERHGELRALLADAGLLPAAVPD